MILYKKKILKICFLFSISFFLSGQNMINQEIVKLLNTTVFEVVLKKTDTDPLTYEKELPMDLIPYHIRTDEYISIGTAFAIDSNTLLTASHVLALENESLRNQIFLRDVASNIYSINEIYKYDTQKDFALFSVNDLDLTNWLSLDEEISLNTTVMAVGNAHGQGIIIREGLLTSQTPERFNGEWNWLRYSAAASPGNSGGPLINEDGKVIGIVTAKSKNENLNYALPVVEIGELKAESARLRINFSYSIPVLQAQDQEKLDFKVNLPMRINDLREILIKERNASFRKSLDDLLEENKDELFPYDLEGQKAIFHTTNFGQFPVIATEKDDSTWFMAQPKEIKKSIISPAGSLSFGTMWGDTFFLLKDLDSDKIHKIFEQPELLMDSIIEGYIPTRNVGSESIKITSFGEAESVEWFYDYWGRKWITASFPIPFADKSAILYALPTPAGAIGVFTFADYGNREAFSMDLKKMVDLIGFAYEASLEKWNRFIQWKEYLPSFFENISFTYEIGSQLEFSTERLSLQYDHNLIGISPKSILTLVPSFQLDKEVTNWNISRIFLYENEDKRSYISMERIFPPLNNSDTKNLEKWNNLLEGRYPYTGNSILSKGKTYMYENKTPPGAHANSNALHFSWAVGLCVDSEISSQEMNERFRYLMNGFELKNPEGESASFGFDNYNAETLTSINGSTIFQAISNNNMDLIEKYLEKEIDINRVNYEGRTPIMLAARLDKTEIVNTLLEADVDLRTQDKYGNTLLILALRYLPEEIALKIIKKGETLNTSDSEGYTPLMEACKKEYSKSAELLINMGSELESNNKFGKSALYYSVYYGMDDISRKLINRGVPLNSKHTNGFSTLMAAFAHSSIDIVRLLIENGAPLDEVTTAGWSTLHSAIRYGTDDIAWKVLKSSTYLESKSGDGWTPLHLALRYDKLQIAKYLIENEVQLNNLNNNRWTELHFAIRYNQPEIARILLDKEVELNIENENNWTPLHLALRYNQPDIAKLLIQQGADINVKNDIEWTPLHYALRYNNSTIVEEIIGKGGDINAKTNENWTPLLMALRYNDAEICNLLIDKGADVNQINTNNKTPLMFAAKYNPSLVEGLLEKGAAVNAIDDKGNTGLFFAIEGENKEALKTLLNHGAQLSIKNNEDKTALQFAFDKGLQDLFEYKTVP